MSFVGHDKFKDIRFIIYIAEIIGFFTIQRSFNIIYDILGIKPYVLIPIFISIGMLEGGNAGLVFGCIIGFLIDICGGSIFGFWMIILSVLGSVIDFLIDEEMFTNIITFSVVSLASLIIIFGFDFLFNFIILGHKDRLFAFCNTYLLKLLYTFLISPLFYLFNRTIYFAISEDEGEF